MAPDAGFAKKAREWANRLQAPTAIADKRRVDHTESAEIVELIGSVEGRTALIVDDFTISAGTRWSNGCPSADRAGRHLGARSEPRAAGR